MSNKFCADIHNNLAITLNTSRRIQVAACCWEALPTQIDNNQDPWKTPKLVQLRELNKKDQLDTKSCGQCIYMEKHGNSSRRTGVNEYYNSTATDLSGPRGLEIKIDYTCNIACVYCGPYNSTQWRLELGTPKKQFPIRLTEPDIIKLLDRIDLSNLDNIHFYGGDPLLTNTHQLILNYIDQRVGLSKIYAWYNTNGTIRVNQQVQELWSRCRLVKVFFSIDDIGTRFEYIRYGAVWNEVEDNMLWYRDSMPNNVMFTIHSTMSCLNSLHHYELLKWKTEYFNTNRLGDFTDVTRHNVFRTFELTSMPDELMQKCLDLNSQYLWFRDFIKSFKYDSIQHNQTKKLISSTDARRGCNFSTTFPDLVPYFID
jgi:organic radical activating enzyme